MSEDILEIYSAALAEFKAGNFERALEISAELKKIAPDWAKNFLLESYVYRAQKKHLHEIESVKKCIELAEKSGDKKTAATAFSILGASYRVVGEPEKAVENFCRSAEFEDDLKQKRVEISNAIFAASDAENFGADDFGKLYSLYRKTFEKIVPLEKKFFRHEKIRVGYLSADFHNHPVTYFFWALIAGADKNNFSVYCYSSSRRSDLITENIKNFSDGWRDISDLNDEDAAKIIRADEIDILFDLAGHTSNNRLGIFAYRPANVQISGIGFMNSTGIFETDYFLSDKFCAGDKTACEKYFTEKILELPHSHFCYTPLKNFPATGDAPCVEKNFVTFGCFNNFNKVTDSILKIWAEILRRVPESRLILKHEIFAGDEGREIVRQRLQKFNFDLRRVEMRGFSYSYLNEYLEIDIALDTFPYTGGITTCEALYMGVPVISLFGDRHGTRFGLSILNNAGIGELAVASPEEYIERAVALSGDKELLSVLHKNLRAMIESSHLMNMSEYVRAVEKKYFEIYTGKCIPEKNLR